MADGFRNSSSGQTTWGLLARRAGQQGTAPLQGSTQMSARRAGLGASRREARRAVRVPAGQHQSAAPWASMRDQSASSRELPLSTSTALSDGSERCTRIAKREEPSREQPFPAECNTLLLTHPTQPVPSRRADLTDRKRDDEPTISDICRKCRRNRSIRIS